LAHVRNLDTSELRGALGCGGSGNPVVGEQRPVIGVQGVMQPERARHREGWTGGGSQALTAHHDRGKREAQLVQCVNGEQIVVQPGTTLAQQSLEAGSCKLIDNLSQIKCGAFSLEHGHAGCPQWLKIFCGLPCSRDDHDGSSDILPRCGNSRIKISARRDDHQHWIGSKTLLLADLELPRFKIDGPVALGAHRIGPDQNCISQGPLQSKDMVITFGVDAARSSIGTLHGTVKRHDEVAADPAAVPGCGISVQLHQVRVTKSSGRATVGAEDQLHRTIVARHIGQQCTLSLSKRPFDKLRAHQVEVQVSVGHNRRMVKKSSRDEAFPLITKPLSEVLRLPAGQVDLTAFDPAATPGFPGDKQNAAAITEALAPELSDLQERLFASGRADESTTQRILLVLQGMDTSGKGGVIRHAIGMVDPQGVKIKAFKAPTEEERAHHFLWRIERELPQPGLIGIFDRSHYEDVLVARVHNLVEESVWRQRYDEINSWEDDLVEQGTVLIKCFLNISSAEQKERLLARLDDPTKHWKYNPGDVAERAKWPAYMESYRAVLERCNTERAPWYVIPSDRKWYRNWAVAQLLVEHLRGLDLRWPAADFDVEVEKARVAAS
jgi:PPK2 family polyphosphate:nucleotide phosphotransferase